MRRRINIRLRCSKKVPFVWPVVAYKGQAACRQPLPLWVISKRMCVTIPGQLPRSLPQTYLVTWLLRFSPEPRHPPLLLFQKRPYELLRCGSPSFENNVVGHLLRLIPDVIFFPFCNHYFRDLTPPSSILTVISPAPCSEVSIRRTRRCGLASIDSLFSPANGAPFLHPAMA